MSLHSARLVFLALALPLAACPPARNSPATWTAATYFNVKAQDPRALKIADEVVATVGGEANWAKAKEIEWSQVIVLDGKPVVESQHAWDRWNGRHRMQQVQNGNGFLVQYDLFQKTGKGWGIVEGRERTATREQMADMMNRASVFLAQDAYLLCLPFKLRDPGVHLRWMEERPDPGDAARKLDVLRVSFDPGVGKDVYYLAIDRTTHMPYSVEWVKGGQEGTARIGYRYLDWTEVGGLKFATKRQNLGYAGEVVNVSDIKVAEKPHEDYYVPEVQFGD